MEHLIKGKNTSPALQISLAQDETIVTAPDRIFAAGGDIRITPFRKPGLLRQWASKLKGKTLDLDSIQAVHDNAWILLSPAPQTTVPQNGLAVLDFFIGTTHRTEIVMTQNTFLAAQSDIHIDAAEARDLRQLGESFKIDLWVLHGQGKAFITGTGAIEQIIVQPHQDLTIDAAYLLAWESSVTCTALKTSPFDVPDRKKDQRKILSIHGKGSIWIQTRPHTAQHE